MSVTGHYAALSPATLPDHDLSRMLLDNLATGVFGIDRAGRFTFLNQAATRLFGFATPEAVLGKESHSLTCHANDLGIRYHESDCPIYRVMSTGTPLESGTDTFRRADGSPFFAHLHAAPLRDSEGVVCGAVVAVEDITERLFRERTLAQYKAVFEAARDAIVLHDQRVIVHCNPSSVALFGAHTPTDLIGRHPGGCSPEFQPDGRPSREAADAYTKQALAEGSVAYEWLCQALDGRTFPSEVMLSRVDLPEGPILQAVIRDITDRQMAERALRRSESELAAAQEIAQLGSWAWDIASGTIAWSDEVYRIFGVQRANFSPNYSDFLRFVHPSDRERLTTAIDQSLNGPGDYDLEHRILRADGSQRTIHQRGRIVRDPTGRALRMRGTVQDVTERRALEDQLRYERDLGEMVLEGLPAIFFLLDAEGRPIRWNRNLETVIGVPPDGIGGHRAIEGVDPADRHRVTAAIKRTLNEGSGDVEAGLVSRNGWPIPYYFTGNRVELANEVFLVGFGVDLSERRRLELELERQASHDSLTGLYNRWKFEEALNLETERARRYGTEFSLVMFDIDAFKEVNDTYGHDVGDAVLRKIAAVVGQQIRRTDILARWGGEEFMILLSETSLDHATRLAEATRIRVAQADFPGPGRLTISLGVTQYLQGETISTLLKRVDNAMYEAKQRGRDCTVAA
jgi:diguanylate cyclase (GGDEF)-like protein/PAS domain S-box-containing protein